MVKSIKGFLLLLGLATLPACGTFWSSQAETDAALLEKLEPITVRVSGYGTYADIKTRQQAQQRLLARRASELDAYRALAERVYGTVVFGSSTVSDFVLRDDHLQAIVDSYVRGAKVVSVIEHKDGVVETIMQLKLEPRFRACVAAVLPEDAASLCPIPMPRGNDTTGDSEATQDGPNALYYLESGA